MSDRPAGNPEKDQNGAVQPRDVLVGKPAYTDPEPGPSNGCDLVDHQPTRGT